MNRRILRALGSVLLCILAMCFSACAIRTDKTNPDEQVHESTETTSTMTQEEARSALREHELRVKDLDSLLSTQGKSEDSPADDIPIDVEDDDDTLLGNGDDRGLDDLPPVVLEGMDLQETERVEPVEPTGEHGEVDDQYQQFGTVCDQKCGIATDLCVSRAEICDIAVLFPNDADFETTCSWASGLCTSAVSDCDVCKR